MKSIDFYKKIYKEGVKHFWILRPTFIALLFVGILLLSITLGTILSLWMRNNKIEFVSIFVFLGILGMLLCYPFSRWIFRLQATIRKNPESIPERSDDYKKVLEEIRSGKTDGGPFDGIGALSNKDIKKLIDDINSLNKLYESQRNTLVRGFTSFIKIAVFPFTVIVYKVITEDVALATGLSVVIFCVGFELFMIFWSNFDTLNDFKKIGIKNSYLLNSVKSELIYMEKLPEISNKTDDSKVDTEITSNADSKMFIQTKGNGELFTMKKNRKNMHYLEWVIFFL